MEFIIMQLHLLQSSNTIILEYPRIQLPNEFLLKKKIT